MNPPFVSLSALFAAAVTAGLMLVSTPNVLEAQRRPSGSYQNSCRSIFIERGGVLRADCKTTSGSWRRSSIRVSQCKGQDIANLNGRLVCTKGRPGKDNIGKGNSGKGNSGKGVYSDRGRNDRWEGNRNGRHQDSRGKVSSGGRSGIVIYDRTGYGGRSF